MNKLEIAAHLLSLRDPKVLKKDHKLTEKAFNLKLFDAVYRKGPDHYGAGLEGFETWIVMLAIASFCKSGETECEIEDADLVRRVKDIGTCFSVLAERFR